jgi:hypothetical protein
MKAPLVHELNALSDRLSREQDEEFDRLTATVEYFRAHPDFASIVKSMRNSFPLESSQKIMQAARRAENARNETIQRWQALSKLRFENDD